MIASLCFRVQDGVRRSISVAVGAMSREYSGAAGVALASGVALFSANATGNSCALDADVKAQLARMELSQRAGETGWLVGGRGASGEWGWIGGWVSGVGGRVWGWLGGAGWGVADRWFEREGQGGLGRGCGRRLGWGLGGEGVGMTSGVIA